MQALAASPSTTRSLAVTSSNRSSARPAARSVVVAATRSNDSAPAVSVAPALAAFAAAAVLVRFISEWPQSGN